MKTITSLRKEKKLTQAELAEALGQSQQTIADWENKQPDLSGESLISLSRYFSISTDELLGLK
ncbi:helix-turn-helix transcriptional regulator [Aerococcus sp. UMB1112A]|uniref:helix-turn-helix domain-containing protein n=1 Tax=Aerococcus sp. UMB1112A TaxID=3050609 RepID=UPI00254C9984|nr:helix-turn-helix transcriptional regulator [Aerococcus sp. UMB1112A]MDK8502108.1 helix-turn-helix transcriptional regulator [Aerococcus sp. UMB1112A]